MLGGKHLSTVIALCSCALLVSCRNPGYAIRVTKSGLKYAAQVGGQVVGQYVSKVVIPPLSFSARGISLALENIKIDKFDGAQWDLTPTPPNSVVLRLSRASMDCKGSFKGNIVLIGDVSGKIEAMAGGIGINIAIAIGADETGRPTVTETSCSASTASFDIKLSGGSFVKFINVFHKQIANAVKPDILNAICSALKTEVNTDLRKILATVPTVIDLGDGFGVDYRLMSVSVTSDYLEITGRGEIDFQGNNTDPYGAPALDRSGAADQLMAYFWGSQYILDSAAYQLQRSGVLELNVTEDSVPQAKNMLETTCEALCVGTIIKEIGEDYPNTTTGLYLKSTDIPTISIASTGGVLSARGSVDLSVLENGAYSALAGADLNVTADVVPALSGNNITGKVYIRQMQIAGTYSNLQDPVAWEFLAHLTQNILQNEINRLLSAGIPIPSFDGVTIVNPYMALKDKTLEVAANVTYQPMAL